MNYGTIDLSPGDRVICRNNDSQLDVDNGTRGTVLAVNEHAVTITTDAGVVRELPSDYVKEHLELAYALTGHGMQGGTVEHADRPRRPSRPHRGVELHRPVARPRKKHAPDL